jgi:hypothetical protein
LVVDFCFVRDGCLVFAIVASLPYALR